MPIRCCALNRVSHKIQSATAINTGAPSIHMRSFHTGMRWSAA